MLQAKIIAAKQDPTLKRQQFIQLFVQLALIVSLGSIFLWIIQTQSIEREAPQMSDTIVKFSTGDPNPCPKRHNISYIWMKGDMPSKYKEFTERCKNNINIVNEQDYHNYVKMWNEKFPQYEIKDHESYPQALQIEYLKKLHLYFKGGIYSDFETQIDETCWQNLVTQRIVFTNILDGRAGENFMKVSKALDHKVQNWIIELIYETKGYSYKRDLCRMDQCFFIFCQAYNA